MPAGSGVSNATRLSTRRVCLVDMACPTYLLHDTSLALGEGDVTTRFVLDELDLNLPPLAARLVVVVVVVVRGGGGGALALDAASFAGAITVLEIIVHTGRIVLVVLGDFASHDARRDDQ